MGAELLQLINRKEQTPLRFGGKPCVRNEGGMIKKSVLDAIPASPLTFHKKRPVVTGMH